MKELRSTTYDINMANVNIPGLLPADDTIPVSNLQFTHSTTLPNNGAWCITPTKAAT